jgi:serine/threonine protein kinase
VPLCPQCHGFVPTGTRVCPTCHALQPTSPPPREATLGPGGTLDVGYGRIVIDSRIGEGGMGIVWRAWLFWAPASGRAHEPPAPIALKVLHPRARGRAELRAFFVSEAEALKQLSHPNIVRFHALIEQGPLLAIAMEYVDGDTLEEVIARQVARARIAGPNALPGLPFLRAWYYFQQLLGALAATHALGFVHRDVKPSNVLVRKDGIVKLTDFGIARLAREAPTSPATPSEMAPGTGAYMSPEQVLSWPLDGRSDLYSAGVVLYEMLAGRTPFSTEDRTEFLVRRDQVESAPPPIRAFLPQAPPVLELLFARALAKDPAARFSSAIDMGNAFRAALGLAETPEWQAQAEMAREAAPALDPNAAPARAQRIATLRDFLVDRYRTAKMQAR